MNEREFELVEGRETPAIEKYLRCAETLLDNREHFSGPGCASILTWAEEIIARFGPREKREPAA